MHTRVYAQVWSCTFTHHEVEEPCVSICSVTVSLLQQLAILTLPLGAEGPEGPEDRFQIGAHTS